MYNERTSVGGYQPPQRFVLTHVCPGRRSPNYRPGLSSTAPVPRGEGGAFVSNCNPTHPDCKSTAEDFAHHSQPRLSPAEKARRVARLRAVLHAPAFQARIDAVQRRDRT